MATEFDAEAERRKMLEAGMKAKKLNQTQLAELLGVSQPTVSRWISGKKEIPEERYLELAEVLDLSPDMFRTGSAYVRSDDQIVRWIFDVMQNTPNPYAMACLVALPQFMRENGEVLVHEELIAEAVDTLSVDKVRDLAWPSVLNSPFVELVPGARWVFRLKFPEDP